MSRARLCRGAETDGPVDSWNKWRMGRQAEVRTDRRMDGRLAAWIDGWLAGWTATLPDKSIGGWMNEQTDGFADGHLERRVDGWKNGRVGGRMDGRAGGLQADQCVGGWMRGVCVWRRARATPTTRGSAVGQRH
eukprot:51133-Chlamydomonas_euryale.AAC.2